MNDLYNLVVEVTRKCNFKCGHCLRGEAQEKDLDLVAFRNFLQKTEIKYISVLTLTGGEPLMNPKIIRDLVYDLENAGVEVGSYYIATNGSYFNYDALLSINYLHNFCKSNDTSCIQVSNSIWHEEERDQLGIYLYDDIESIYSKIEEELFDSGMETYDVDLKMGFILTNEILVISDDRIYKNLIREGRAEKFGTRSVIVEEKNDDEDEMLYFSVNGDVVMGVSDLSYKNIRKQRVK